MKAVKAFTILEVMVALLITTIVFALGSQAMISLTRNSQFITNMGEERNSLLALHTTLEHHFLNADNVERTTDGLLFNYDSDQLECVIGKETCSFFRGEQELEQFNVVLQIKSIEREGLKVKSLELQVDTKKPQVWWFNKTYSLQQLKGL